MAHIEFDFVKFLPWCIIWYLGYVHVDGDSAQSRKARANAVYPFFAYFDGTRESIGACFIKVKVVIKAEGVPAVKETDCFVVDLTASTDDGRALYGGRNPFGCLGLCIINRGVLNRDRVRIDKQVLIDLIA